MATYGARGDGVADDTAAIQAAINAATSGNVVFLPPPPAFYKISATIRVTKSITLLGSDSLIKSPGAACPTFILITANDVTVRSLRLVGPQRICGHAIDMGSGSPTLTNVTVQDNRIDNFYAGILVQGVDGFRVAGNELTNLTDFGIDTFPAKNGVIDHNIVLNVSGDGGNAYGIVASRNASSPNNPRSTDIVISNNRVENIPIWECYDTHGGQRIHFIDNTCKNAKLGINVAFSGTGRTDPNALAPIECEVRGNTIEKNPAEAYRDAIVFAGTTTQAATGVVADNILVGFGPTGIYVVNTSVMPTNTTRR